MLLRPVGSGKTALTLALCKKMRDEYNIGELPIFRVYGKALTIRISYGYQRYLHPGRPGIPDKE